MTNEIIRHRNEVLRNVAIAQLGSTEAADAMLPGLIERLDRRIANANQRCEGPCKQVLHISMFSKDSQNVNGLRRWCRECSSNLKQAKKAARAKLEV